MRATGERVAELRVVVDDPPVARRHARVLERAGRGVRCARSGEAALAARREWRRVGGTRELRANVRFIAATARDLACEVNAGRFREDLDCMSSGMAVRLPPPGARPREDLAERIGGLLDELAPHRPDPPRRVDEAALGARLRDPWPGTIRERRNVTKRGMLVARWASALQLRALPLEVRGASGNVGWGDGGDRRAIADVVRAHTGRVLPLHEGNRTRAARHLGIPRATLDTQVQEPGVVGAPSSPPRRRGAPEAFGSEERPA